MLSAVSAISVWSSGVISRLSLFISWTRCTSTPRSSIDASITSSTDTWLASTPESSSYVFSIVPPVEMIATRFLGMVLLGRRRGLVGERAHLVLERGELGAEPAHDLVERGDRAVLVREPDLEVHQSFAHVLVRHRRDHNSVTDRLAALARRGTPGPSRAGAASRCA